MASVTLGPRALGPGIGGRPAVGGVDDDRDGRLRSTVAAAGPVDHVDRWEGAAETVRILGATIAVYAILIALPFLAMVPVVLAGAVLGIIATLVGGSV